MDPEQLAHWRAADAAFDRWLDLPEHERDDWLEAQALPLAVRRRLGQLVAAHRRPRAALDPVAGDLSGQRLGDWILDAELGRGGMSVVYRGCREQGMAKQHAAIKVLTLGALGASGRERFRREAEILARLNHPGITPLVDSGVAGDGTCWLAMPLVEGERVDRWCEANSPDARAIVRLYLQVCDAVAYAHRNLVVHRDLKPSNVLVDAGGHVHLLDFGIGQFTDSPGERTNTLWRALTPGYAAPEQLRGAAPSTAIDVYGLGALLHRLLTGRTPQARDGGTETTRPSLLVREAGDACHRHYVPLKNDLDRVLLKALAEDPARRYATTESLADDLRRWLEGMPVLARDPGAGYRARKFIARHKAGVAATLLLAASVAGGIGATVWQARAARLEAQRSLAARDFMVRLFEASDPNVAQGRVISARELLDQGAHQIRTAFPDTPHQRTEMLLLLGDLYRRIGELEAAAPLLERGLELASARGDQALLLDARTRLALLHLDADRPAEALAEIERAMRLLASVDRIPGSRHGRLLRSEVLALSESGRVPDAVRRAEAALALARRRPVEPEALFLYLHATSTALEQSGQVERAEALLHEALALRSTDSLAPTDRLPVHTMLSSFALARGDLGESLAQAASALALADQVYAPMHPGRAGMLNSSAVVLSNMGRLDEAEAMLREAIAILESADPGVRTTSLASAYNNLALALDLAERDGEAVPFMIRSRELAAGLFGVEDPRYAIATANLGNLYRQLDRFAEADPLLAGSLELRRALLGDAHPYVGHGIVQLARLRLAQGRASEALALADEAAALYAGADYKDPRRLASTGEVRASAMARLGRTAEAGEAFERIVADARSAGIDDGVEWPRTLAARADFVAAHDPARAPAAIAEAHAAYSHVFGEGHPGTRRFAALARDGGAVDTRR